MKALVWANAAGSRIFTSTALSPQSGPQHELGSMEPSPGGPHSPAPRTAASTFPLGAWEEEEALASLCPPGHPRRSAASAGLPGENPICPDTQHQWPRPRQALGDKGPLLSSAGPGTGTSSAQQSQTAGHPRSRTERRKGWGRKIGLSLRPIPNFFLFPRLSPPQSVPLAQNFRAGDLLELLSLPSEEPEAQRGKGTCPEPQSKRKGALRLPVS